MQTDEHIGPNDGVYRVGVIHMLLLIYPVFGSKSERKKNPYINFFFVTLNDKRRMIS